MLLKRAPLQKITTTRQRGRSVAVLRCAAAAPADPDTSAPPRQRRPFSSSLPTSVATPTRGPRRTRGEDVEGQQSSRQLLPYVTFLEDDADRVSHYVKVMFPRCFGQGGEGVMVRSLGRQGTAGAMRYLIALREELAAAAAAADEEPRDLRCFLIPQAAIKPFGTPFMMIASPVLGRMQLPEEGSPQLLSTVVSGRTDSARLAGWMQSQLSNLKPDQYIRLEMVGTEALHRGMSALRDGLAQITTGRGSYFAVPELVSLPLRHSRQRQEGEGEGPEAAAAAAAPEQPSAEAVLVQVVRVYVGTLRASQVAAARSESHDARLAGSASRTGVDAGVGAEAPVAPADKVLVSNAEMDELKGALGNMMEQQKVLMELLAQRQAAAAEGQQPAAAAPQA